MNYNGIPHVTPHPELGFDLSHQHGVLPNLKWVSGGDMEKTSHSIATEAELLWWRGFYVFQWDESLLSQYRNFDFRYLQREELPLDWHKFVDKLWEVVSRIYSTTYNLPILMYP